MELEIGYLLENVEAPNPIIDFIPANYVGSFVTNKFVTSCFLLSSTPKTRHFLFLLDQVLTLDNSGILAPNAIYRATLDLYHMTECDLL